MWLHDLNCRPVYFYFILQTPLHSARATIIGHTSAYRHSIPSESLVHFLISSLRDIHEHSLILLLNIHYAPLVFSGGFCFGLYVKFGPSYDVYAQSVGLVMYVTIIYIIGSILFYRLWVETKGKIISYITYLCVLAKEGLA
jgi:hypothetical protein